MLAGLVLARAVRRRGLRSFRYHAARHTIGLIDFLEVLGNLVTEQEFPNLSARSTKGVVLLVDGRFQ